MGKTIALSAIHGGPGPSFFAYFVVDYIFGGLGTVSLRPSDIPDLVIQD